MTWFKVDDGFHCHPKVLRAGNEAVGLYARCGSYCAQHLTDGFVPEPVAGLYGSRELAQVLVTEGLWRPVRGGYRMHDYLDYNPSREHVEAERKAAAERQKQYRERKARERAVSAETNAMTNGVSNTVTPSDPFPRVVGNGSERKEPRNGVTSPSFTRESQCPDPTRPDPTRSTTSGYVQESSSPRVAAPTSPRDETRGRKRERGRRIPADFTVSADMHEWAREHVPHVDVTLETDQFRDYWQAKSGANAIKIDWVATWRTWMRKAEQQAPRQRRLAAIPARVPTTTQRLNAIEALRHRPGNAS